MLAITCRAVTSTTRGVPSGSGSDTRIPVPVVVAPPGAPATGTVAWMIAVVKSNGMDLLWPESPASRQLAPPPVRLQKRWTRKVRVQDAVSRPAHRQDRP